MNTYACLLAGLSSLASVLPARALTPDEVFILVNKNVAASREVAEHYCAKRGVPLAHIVMLDLPHGEDISRQDYDLRLIAPLRLALKDHRAKARVLLSVYGVPLRVGPQLPTALEKTRLDEVKAEIKKLQAEPASQKDQLAWRTR